MLGQVDERKLVMDSKMYERMELTAMALRAAAEDSICEC